MIVPTIEFVRACEDIMEVLNRESVSYGGKREIADLLAKIPGSAETIEEPIEDGE